MKKYFHRKVEQFFHFLDEDIKCQHPTDTRHMPWQYKGENVKDNLDRTGGVESVGKSCVLQVTTKQKVALLDGIHG